MPRARKSIELSKKLGTAQAQRVLGRSDVAPGPAAEPPTWLTAKAAKIWEIEAAALRQANLIQRIDSNTLAQYCEALAVWLIEKRRRKNRDPAEIARWFDRAARLAKELGMTPKARTAITVPNTEQEDDLDSLIA